MINTAPPFPASNKLLEPSQPPCNRSLPANVLLLLPPAPCWPPAAIAGLSDNAPACEAVPQAPALALLLLIPFELLDKG